MNWKQLIPTCSADQTIARAKSALAGQTIYQLGAGDIDPSLPLTKTCDCSGFVCWSIGIPREFPPGSNQWIDTDCIWSGGAPVKPGLFTEIKMGNALPGDLLVYPHNGQGQHGHVGIILLCPAGKPLTVIHCSLGNYEQRNNAVRVTGPAVFLSGNHPTRIMRIDYALLKSFL
ncbi:MAG TPA: hypothetical protein VGM41_07610 [Chitinophagaceae bacterium]|jgi:hypothetical protein